MKPEETSELYHPQSTKMTQKSTGSQTPCSGHREEETRLWGQITEALHAQTRAIQEQTEVIQSLTQTTREISDAQGQVLQKTRDLLHTIKGVTQQRSNGREETNLEPTISQYTNLTAGPSQTLLSVKPKQETECRIDSVTGINEQKASEKNESSGPSSSQLHISKTGNTDSSTKMSEADSRTLMEWHNYSASGPPEVAAEEDLSSFNLISASKCNVCNSDLMESFIRNREEETEVFRQIAKALLSQVQATQRVANAMVELKAIQLAQVELLQELLDYLKNNTDLGLDDLTLAPGKSSLLIY